MHVPEAAASQTAALPFTLWMSWQWPLHFFLKLFSHFSNQIHELLMTPHAFFFLQRKNVFIGTIWGGCEQPSFCSCTCSDFVVAERTDEALFSFWKSLEMDLNSTLSWGAHSKSRFNPHILQYMMDATSERQTRPQTANNIHTYMLCPLLCQSDAPVWDMLEHNVESSQVFRKWGCSVSFQCFINKAWLNYEICLLTHAWAWRRWLTWGSFLREASFFSVHYFFMMIICKYCRFQIACVWTHIWLKGHDLIVTDGFIQTKLHLSNI